MKNSYTERKAEILMNGPCAQPLLSAAALKMHESFSYNARHITKWQLCFFGPSSDSGNQSQTGKARNNDLRDGDRLFCQKVCKWGKISAWTAA